MPPKQADPSATCLGCSKKFNKTDYSLQCTVCGLWIHKTCSGLSDDGYKFVSEQLQTTGVGYWACRACASYAVNMNHRLKQMEDKMEQYLKKVDTNTTALKVVDKKVEDISAVVKRNEDKTDKLVKQSELSVYDEMRERETRRLNVVFFGIPELNERNATGKDKLEWDRKSCCNVFDALELDLGENSIKFCRRIGEKLDKPRPLVTGFWTEMERAMLLKNAKKLEKTSFSNVNVAADLSKIQRDQEKEMKKEAKRRNAQLSEEDQSKNLQWMVVGARGEKRFVKTIPRDPPAQRGRTPARGRGTRGTRGGGTRGRISGSNTIPIGTRTNTVTEPAENMEEEPSETESETETETEEGEANNGRKRKGGRTTEAPPEKR